MEQFFCAVSGLFPLVRRETFPPEPTRQACDRGQRGQGCAALEEIEDGLDLDHGARRGGMMAGRLLMYEVRAMGEDKCLNIVGRLNESYTSVSKKVPHTEVAG
jgi:hypothetical protein